MTTQAVKDKGAEHSKHELIARRIVSYLVLTILCFLCLFFFYVLIINATRNHYQIQRGFSFLPGKSFMTNLNNVLADANIPILSGIKNSLFVSALSAALSIYFSALTAYGVHAYDFKLKKIASAFIILIMTMPTQVSALGFVRLITGMKLNDTLIPLFLPSIAAPTVYYFMISYMKSNCPAPQRGLPQVRYGSGVYAHRNRHHAGHRRLPFTEQVHRRGRCLGRRKGLTAQGYFGHCFCDYTFPQDGKSAEKPLLCRLFIFPFFSVCVMILSTKKNMEVHRHELSQGLHLGRGNRVLPNRGCCF